jgi:hypothetical protein
MSTEPAGGDFAQDSELWVEPTPGVARTIGTLNIIFGIVLLLCGGCYGASMLWFSAMAPMVHGQQQQAQQQMQAQIDAARQQRIDALKKQEEETEDDEEWVRLHAERTKLEKQPQAAVDFPDPLRMYGLDDPRVMGYYVIDSLTGIALNIAMLISGVALVNLREWGRRLAIWIAAFKIVRLLALYGFYIAVIVPIISARMVEMFEQMNRTVQQAGGPAGAPPVAAMGAGVATAMAAGALFILGGGIIYPIVALILLTRAGVKAATQSRPRAA